MKLTKEEIHEILEKSISISDDFSFSVYNNIYYVLHYSYITTTFYIFNLKEKDLKTSPHININKYEFMNIISEKNGGYVEYTENRYIAYFDGGTEFYIVNDESDVFEDYMVQKIKNIIRNEKLKILTAC